MNIGHLLTLAEHLERGELGHMLFNFSTFTRGPRQLNGCGTSGCALGECPYLWPKIWGFHFHDGLITPVTRDGNCDPYRSAMYFFGITHEEVYGLFMPGRLGDRPAPWNERVLCDHASAVDVAEGIRNFITWRGKILSNKLSTDKILSNKLTIDYWAPNIRDDMDATEAIREEEELNAQLTGVGFPVAHEHIEYVLNENALNFKQLQEIEDELELEPAAL